MRSRYTPENVNLRNFLIEARQKRGITQEELAEKIGRKQNYISNYERGERRLDIFELIEIIKGIGEDKEKLLCKIMEISSDD